MMMPKYVSLDRTLTMLRCSLKYCECSQPLAVSKPIFHAYRRFCECSGEWSRVSGVSTCATAGGGVTWFRISVTFLGHMLLFVSF